MIARDATSSHGHLPRLNKFIFIIYNLVIAGLLSY